MTFSIHKSFPMFLLSFFLFIQISSCFHWDGNILYDLETNDYSSFSAEASDWILSTYKTPGVKFYNCAGSYVMGGFNVLGGIGGRGSSVMQYFQRTYYSLPTHNQIYLQMRFFQIDTWDLGEGDYFSIGIDSNTITGWELYHAYSGTFSLCGNSDTSFKDFVFTFSLAYPHYGSSLTLKMISYTDEDTINESFGFRDIKIEFLTNTSPYFSLCAPDVSSSYLSALYCSTYCSSSGNYITPTNYGFCFPPSCSSNCKRCSTTSTSCTSCPTGSFLVGTTCYPSCGSPLTTKLLGGVTYCETPCPGQYAWGNGFCSPSCSFSTSYGSYAIVGKTESTFQVCTYPCATNQFLSWNTSCLNSCPSPLLTTTEKGRKFCEYPCASSNYLYWNGSCLSTCPSPLSEEIQGTTDPRKFCWYPCQPDKHLYWNGSCIQSCPSPLTSEIQGTTKQRKFCWYSCQPDEHLYWNGSCINSCPSPLIPEIQATTDPRNFCWYSCQPGEYLYWNGSCLSTCPLPLSSEIQGTTNQRKFCWYSCQPAEYLYWNGSCIQNCPSPLTSEIQGTIDPRNFCWYSCQPTEHLYWNGSCINNCPSPLTSEMQGTTDQRNFCWYSCQPAEHLYWNGSCINSCPSPLSPEIQGVIDQRNFCWYSCQPGEFLYWNGSCLSSCPSPLSPETQGTRNFCWYSCQPDEFLYWNGSCINSCPWPLTPEIQGMIDPRNFCWYSCQPTEYLYWNGSCIQNCPSPLNSEIQGTIDSRNFCWYSCQPAEHLYWNGSCINSCPSPLTPEIQATIDPRNFCWYSCQPGEYLYWNGSCLSTCPSPLSSETQGTIDSRNFCWYSCQPGEFLYWNGSCINGCPWPLTPEIQGTTDLRNFCWYSCQPGEHLYWNGSCINSCPSPLTSEIQGTSQQRNFCWYSCPETDYLYWNGSCINSCPSPLVPEIQGTTDLRNFCWYPCQPDEFLYWNESCINSCPSPLTSEIQGTSQQRNFCWYSCLETDYLYWNGSCLNNCPSPLTPEIQATIDPRNFCWYTCQPSEYLYWNGSCLNNCPIHLLSFDYSGNQFCFLPCDMPNIYWYQDLSCRPECNFPYVLVFQDSVYQCLKPCPRSEYIYDLENECHNSCDSPYIRQTINTIKVCHIDASTLALETSKIKSTAQVMQTFGKASSAVIKATSIPQVSTPRTGLLVQLSAMMQYFRYMRINYPWKVQMLFQANDASLISLNIDFDIPIRVRDKFENRPLPDVFEKYSLKSNFVNNMWDLINTILLVIFGIIVLLFLRKTLKKSLKIHRAITKILQIFRWNLLLAMLSSGAGEIIFYASLQIRSTSLDSAVSIVSFFVSLLMIFLILFLLVICFQILRGFHRQKQRTTPTASSENQDWLDKWKGYEMLYEEIEGKSLFSLAYMAIYIMRAIFFFAIIANFYDYPLAQSISITVINLLSFLYLLFCKPLKDIWISIQLLLSELLGNILTICVLTLAILDRAEIEALDSRVAIGNVIVIVMLIFYIMGMMFLIIQGVLFSIETYKTWKELRARGIRNPLKMIKISLFGETAKTHPEETTLDLSSNLSSIALQQGYLQKLENDEKIHCDDKVREKDSSMISESPLDLSSSPILPVNPVEVKIAGSDVQDSKIQINEPEIEVFRMFRPERKITQKERKSKKIDSDENISEVVLSTTPEPISQPSANFIKSWGNLKARLKRFNVNEK